MDYKTFFVKKIMMSFFVSVTCICAVMALIGMIFESDIRFGYEAFLSPLIFGAIASLPLLVKYSRSELSLKQTVVRNVIHFVLLEAVILSVLYFGEILTSMSMAISLGISIFVVDLTVNLVLWINDKRIANEFNSALKILQNDCSASK
ncbi:hypothetical protein [Kineothrix sp. MB12-C1]|uniref:hypothetical protein n=1 Tax=Kineothrix sp. MB12-C1 TaxID=3070215 RepID=UPI0027D3473E|nr:hypothetical protein [Kineothrix sp. MB12-C1]WMC92358.1 hypothetical protein RBB56_16175 [Kineothrix sp. MB12-C1]